jgi:hypothetical protein
LACYLPPTFDDDCGTDLQETFKARDFCGNAQPDLPNLGQYYTEKIEKQEIMLDHIRPKKPVHFALEISYPVTAIPNAGGTHGHVQISL